MTLKSVVKGFALVSSSPPPSPPSPTFSRQEGEGELWPGLALPASGAGVLLEMVEGVLLCVWEFAGAQCCWSRRKAMVAGDRGQESPWREQTMCSGCGC